jgi:hypothetical protein
MMSRRCARTNRRATLKGKGPDYVSRIYFVVVGNTIWYHCVTLVVWCDWLTRIRTAGRITWGLGWPSRVTPSEVVPLLLARRFKPVTRTIKIRQDGTEDGEKLYVIKHD